MKALTLHRPWPWAIFHLPPAWAKRVENRTWEPWPSVLGQRIAIHAGRTFDRPALDFIHGAAGPGPYPVDHLSDEGIIGVVTVTGSRRRRTGEGDPWFVGPVGWLLDDVRVLAQPVSCRGAQGLWDVPPDVEAEIKRQLAAQEDHRG